MGPTMEISEVTEVEVAEAVSEREHFPVGVKPRSCCF